MKIEIPDHELRAFLQCGKNVSINEALLEYLYRDPRFDSAREKLLGDWMIRTLRANLVAGRDVSDEGS